MKAFVLCAALAAVATFASAEETLVARQGDDSVRLADSPCSSDQVLARLPSEHQGDYRAATAVFQGQNFVACWRSMGGVAHLVYEDGDQGIIPMAELRPELVS